ncbi:MAG: tyrosine-type recombinase/integrase [Acidobacteria bacterium]|nr:tyrosine-type recombinase/integrase [Acidobacteriota bacterium]
MLKPYRRHEKNCPHRKKKNPRAHTNCFCSIWVQGYLGNEYLKNRLDTRDWQAAQYKIRELEAAAFLPAPEERPKLAIDEAIKRFVNDAMARNITDATLYKYKMLLDRQLVPFAEEKGFTLISQFDLEALREFRAAWKDSPISAGKKLERLRAFFRFCHDSGYIAENPVVKIKPPKITNAPTLPFTEAEMEKIIWACDLFSTGGRYRALNRTRVRAMVLLLRFSGIRIGDAVTLTRDKIKDGKLMLYTAKTGTPVWLPLKEEVIEELGKLDTHPKYFFWSGEGKLTSAVGVWERTMKRLFEIAGVNDGHCHRFRDTFAVSLLEKGVAIEDVAILLGHSSPAITNKHYNPWVQVRQLRLEDHVRRIW